MGTTVELERLRQVEEDHFLFERHFGFIDIELNFESLFVLLILYCHVTLDCDETK